MLCLKCWMFFLFVFSPSSSISVYLSLLVQSRVLHRAWLCLWSFNIQPGSSVLSTVCVFVFCWSPLCSAKEIQPNWVPSIHYPPPPQHLFTVRQYKTDLINNLIQQISILSLLFRECCASYELVVNPIEPVRKMYMAILCFCLSLPLSCFLAI